MKHSTYLLLSGLIAIVCSTAWAQDFGYVIAESTFAAITVDGDISDWSGIPPIYEDTIGDNNGSNFDFAAAYIANDNDYLYVRITFADVSPFGDEGSMVNVIFNTDLDAATGYGFAGLTGSEFFIQGGNVFDQRSGTKFVDVAEQSGDNNWGAFAFADVAPFEDTTEIEIRLRRDLTFSNDAEGLPGLDNPDDTLLFEYPDFMILFEAEAEWSSVEFMPNADPAGGEAGFEYTFAEGTTAVSAWELF